MDSKYILGITELDSQHKEIETLFTALQDAAENRDRCHFLLESLCERLKFHFYVEESIMGIFAYPEFQEHRRSHREIIKSLEGYRDNILSNAKSEKLRDDRPMQLFFEQIHSQDVRFAAFIKRNKERLGIQ